MKCLAIDDEPMALDIIKDYINKTPFLELSASFRDSLKALDFLQNNPVDLIFLDINMPDLTGIQFLRALTVQPMIIFTTAYSKYAVESYEYDAVDYLLKPIEFDRFLKAVNKAWDHNQLNDQSAAGQTLQKADSEFIMVKSGQDIHNLKADEILYIESAGNYVTFVLPGRKVMSLFSMNKLLEILPGYKFCRIHKSYIVNLQHINKIERHQVLIGKKEVPIGNIYRELFFKAIQK